MTDDRALLQHKGSVTRDDALKDMSGGVFYWTFADHTQTVPMTNLPAWGSYQRDVVLANTPDLEGMWSATINKAITKFAARGYSVKDADDSDRRTQRAQDLISDFDGPACYTSGLAKHLQDFLSTNNGGFIEVVRSGRSPTARPTALYHLDSLRCRRTGNPNYPVVYVDFLGIEHAIPAHNVLMVADMPSPRASYFGRGRCAAERAFRTIVKLAAIEQYFLEKITGRGLLSVHFIQGVTNQQIKALKESSEADALVQRSEAAAANSQMTPTIYRGSAMVGVLGDNAITIGTVDLASVPDKFDVDLERKDAYLRYANSIGIPVQDVQPLSGQGLGTGTQTVILDEAAEGMGLAFWEKWFDRTINRLVLPNATTFSFTTNDTRDQKAKADVLNTKATAYKAMIEAGVLTAPQVLNMLVDDGTVPKEFLPEDLTPGAALTDSGEGSKQVEGDIVPALPAPAVPQLTQGLANLLRPTPAARAAMKELGIDAPDTTTKAKRLTVADLDEAAALEAATKLYQETVTRAS